MSDGLQEGPAILVGGEADSPLAAEPVVDLEEVLEAWALRVGGLLWVLDAEVTGWPLCAEDEERAWGMVREGTRRLVELGVVEVEG